MGYDFDTVVDRKNTNCLKYDFMKERGKPEDLLPLWVADMDFKVPDEVIEAIKDTANHGIFGYSEVKNDYNEVVINWFKSHFGYEFKSEWLVKTPGIVYAICTAIKAYSDISDSVLIQNPVYYPFSLAILENDRKLVNNPLVYKNGKYEIDFEDFENKIIENNVKVFILCNPHNPVGRVYTKEELMKMGDICLKHNVVVVCDEIHMDFVRQGHKHTTFLSIKEEYEKNTIVLTAPSKTFNIAGLQVSNIFIPNRDLKRAFIQEINKTGYSQLNTLGLVATKACYEFGESWLIELKAYLESNLQFMKTFFETKLPKIKLVEPEGTYLAWIDFSEIDLTPKEIDDLIINQAKLWLDSGEIFGKEGENFQRINYACSRALLEKALNNLYETFKNL